MSKLNWIYDKKDYLLIIKELGLLLTMISIILLFPLFVAIFYNEQSAYQPFILASVLSALMGMIMILFNNIYYQFFTPFEEEEAEFNRRHAIGLVVLSWPVISFPSAIPFYLIKPGPENISYLDAYFESVSGWTTTGLTTFGGNADIFLNSINFWRHFMQYLGGLGIIVMGVLILLPMRKWENSMDMIIATGRDYRISPSLRNTIKIISIIYLLIMALGALLFFISGMPPFDSLCHSMAGLSTGGFSVRSDSLMAYNSAAITIASFPIMIIGNTNFVLVYYLLRGKIKTYLKDIESKVFWSLLILFIISFYSWYAYVNGGLFFSFDVNSYPGFIDVLFNVISALTTTGWNTIPYEAWSVGMAPFIFLIIIVSMLVGANTSSTGGGLKAMRIGIVLKSIFWEIEKIVLPRSIVLKRDYHHIEKKYAEDKDLVKIFTFIFIYLIVLLISFIIFLLHGINFSDSLFEVTSAIGTVGLSSGVTSTDLSPLLKIILCIDMWLGRIEVLPIFYFIRYMFGRRI